MAKKAQTGGIAIKSLMSKLEEQSGSYIFIAFLNNYPYLNSRYEIYWFKSGKFTRKGDGGYLNVSSRFFLILKCSLMYEVIFSVGVQRQR